MTSTYPRVVLTLFPDTFAIKAIDNNKIYRSGERLSCSSI